MLDRRYRLAREQFRHQAHHHLAVFQHVGHAGGRAQVVLQYVILACACAYQVYAGDVRIDPARHVQAHHFRAELLVLRHAFLRYAAGSEDFLVMVDIAQKRIQGLCALPQSLCDRAPLGSRDDVRQHVERDQPLRSGLLAVNGKGDPHAME